MSVVLGHGKVLSRSVLELACVPRHFESTGSGREVNRPSSGNWIWTVGAWSRFRAHSLMLCVHETVARLRGRLECTGICRLVSAGGGLCRAPAAHRCKKRRQAKSQRSPTVSKGALDIPLWGSFTCCGPFYGHSRCRTKQLASGDGSWLRPLRKTYPRFSLRRRLNDAAEQPSRND